MSLAERLATPQTNSGGRICTLCAALAEMDADDVAAVHAAIANPAASDRWVWEQLSAEGYDVKESSVGIHRRRGHHTRFDQ